MKKHMDETKKINEIKSSEGIKEVGNEMLKTISLSGMFENWFLDYASYVNLDRAIPSLLDGLKPVQRRILHSMKELDDGRYNKVANIIGNTMKYHPHGDASIGDALVLLGQKNLLVDCQGNWGNPFTGDSAAAPRYIEARLSKFALDVVFNPKTTQWKQSYDGRNNEPIALPTKYPLLLAQGVEGIGVGLAVKILPHNFIELLDASIAHLNEKDFTLYPDFATAGMIDVSRYNDGVQGSRVRVRARIKQIDKKTLAITEIPFGVTTLKLIESVIKANDKGKIKIKKIDDNTAAEVEILVHLAANISPDQTIDALYAFTDCEVSISPNACAIQGNTPEFFGIKNMLKFSVQQTLTLLELELAIRKRELLEKLFHTSLERIFIQERIYKDEGYENAKSRDEAIKHIDKRLVPFQEHFYREIVEEDIIRLFDIRMGRILHYNSEKAEELMKQLNVELKEVEFHLGHLIDYAIDWYLYLKKNYAKGRDRKTEIRSFDTIQATKVAVANAKLYINSEEGFVGTALKKDDFVCDCSDIDDIIVFRADGSYKIVKVQPKFFVGTDVVHIGVFKRNDERTIYNAIYRDGKNGNVYVKRFAVTSITRDKDYVLTKGTKDSKVLYFTANPNGEAEIVQVFYYAKAKAKKNSDSFDFSQLAIKGRSASGNILSKRPVRKVKKKEDGASTLGAIDLWFDDTVKRVNTDERGSYLGAFKGSDKILTIMKSGHLRFMGFDIATHFEDDMIVIEKFSNNNALITVVYWNSELKCHFIKRVELSPTDKTIALFPVEGHNKLVELSLCANPELVLKFDKRKNKKEILDEIISVADFIGIKGIKAKGKRLSAAHIKSVEFITVESEVEEELQEEEVTVFEADTIDVEKSVAPEIEERKPEVTVEEVEEAPEEVTVEKKREKSEVKVAEKKKKGTSKKSTKSKKPKKTTEEEIIKQDPDDIPLEVKTTEDGQLLMDF